MTTVAVLLAVAFAVALFLLVIYAGENERLAQENRRLKETVDELAYDVTVLSRTATRTGANPEFTQLYLQRVLDAPATVPPFTRQVWL